MDTTPLPNGECDPSDSDSISLSEGSPDYYVLRITSHGKFDFDILFKEFQDNPEFCQYVIGRETDTGNEHFHAVIGVDSSVDEQRVRDHIKGFLHPFWVTATGKMPKGFGNKQYNLQACEDLDKAVSYAVKLDEYRYEGFEEAYILARKGESFTKKKPSTFKLEYQQLLDKFAETNMDIDDFMIEFVLLKSKYFQMVSVADAYKYALSAMVRKDSSIAADLVKDYLRKI